MKLKTFLFAALFSTSLLANDCMIGEMKMFAGNFAPRNWALANGQLLSISQNSALFSVLGTTFGGDGRTTFALPDMRGRVAIHAGQGPGLQDKRLGQKSGVESLTLNMPVIPATAKTIDIGDKGRTTPHTLLVPARSASTLNNMQPYTTLNHIICLYGVYPSRS